MQKNKESRKVARQRSRKIISRHFCKIRQIKGFLIKKGGIKPVGRRRIAKKFLSGIINSH